MKKYFDRYYKKTYKIDKRLKHFKMPRNVWLKILHKRLNGKTNL